MATGMWDGWLAVQDGTFKVRGRITDFISTNVQTDFISTNVQNIPPPRLTPERWQKIREHYLPKEKQVTQYQALLPVDLDRHLYAGTTLYDLEKHEFRKINTVTKASTKAGYTTTITFVGGAKRVLKGSEALEEFAQGHKWVTLRNMPEPPETIRHTWLPYSFAHYLAGGDTGITEAGKRMVKDMIQEALKEAPIGKAPAYTGGFEAAPKKKRRWFR